MSLLPMAYLPPISWIARAFQDRQVTLEVCQYYRKQQYTNRLYFRASNRVMPLIIPVSRQGLRIPIKDAQLAYQQNWPDHHWRSLVFAYKNSPYFEYLEDGFRSIYEQRPKYLLELNMALLEKINEWLGLDIQVEFTQRFSGQNLGPHDYRQDFDPQRINFPGWFQPREYVQVFEGFEPDLSIFDLMCNLGPESRTYLTSVIREA